MKAFEFFDSPGAALAAISADPVHQCRPVFYNGKRICIGDIKKSLVEVNEMWYQITFNKLLLLQCESLQGADND